MTEKELKKQYYKEWQEKQPTKYVTWLIFCCGSFIPLIIAFVQIIGGLNDRKAAVMLACIGICAVMELIAIILATEQRRGWNDCRNIYADLLKTTNHKTFVRRKEPRENPVALFIIACEPVSPRTWPSASAGADSDP